jgi:Flagellar hook-length control protein FliK
VHRLMELVVTMDIGLLIPQAGCAAAPPSSSALSEKGQFTQPAPGETFSALFKGLAQNISDELAPSLSDADDLIEPAPSTEANDQAPEAALSGIAVASFFQVRDFQEVVSITDDKGESVQNSRGSTLPSIESIPLLPQGLSVVAPHEDGTLGHEPVPADQPQPRTTDSSFNSLLQPALAHDQSSETPVIQEGSHALDAPPIRKGGSAPVDLAPASLDQPSGDSVLLRTPPPGSLISDQWSSSVMENQGARNVLPAASVNGGVQSLNRPSPEIQPSRMIQEQGAQETTVLGQDLSVPVIGESGDGQDPFGADAQGAGEGTFFHSGENAALESLTRGNQSTFFNSQFTSARQAQSSPEGKGSSVVTSTGDQLKMTQAFLGEDHSATMTSAPGKAQTVHLELPSHDSGPLSVRISMTDQTVHTQFTTDRNDLGALLMGRQDQLQQNLTKSGLELGQFQVHIDQRGQQEAFSDRQSRRNDGTSEQQPASQDHDQRARDRERPNHRPPRALSLFA